MSYCVYASEIAALIGANRYKTRDDVMVRLWKKEQGEDFRLCKLQISTKAGRAVKSSEERAHEAVERVNASRAISTAATLQTAVLTTAPTDVENQVKHLISEDPLVSVMPSARKKQKIEFAVAEAKQAVTKAIQDACADKSQEVQTILESNPPSKAAEELQSAGCFDGDGDQCVAFATQVSNQVAATLVSKVSVPTIQESIRVAVESDERAAPTITALQAVVQDKEAVAAVQSQIHTGIGTRLEDASLNRYASKTQRPVVARNAQGYSKRIQCSGWSFVIYGKVDGLQNDDCLGVVEAKQRQNRLFGRIIEREKIQLYTYLFLTGRKRGTLVETYRDEQNSFHIEFDESEWAEYMRRIRDQMVEIHDLLTDEDNTGRLQILERVLRC